VQIAESVVCEQFVEILLPLLERKDLPAFVAALRGRFTQQQIVDQLKGNQADVRELAAFSLGLVGDRSAIAPLAAALNDDHPATRAMAEHAMWSVWFRLGSPCASRCLIRAAQSMDARDFSAAQCLIAKALEHSPDFAEAYNQRAILHYLNERYEQSLADCRKAVGLMPMHFGAWAGMGHCFAHFGDAKSAIECYEKALSINRFIEGISEAVTQLRCPACNPA
jgi:tetratricopeptide (TPR) repeat protein